MLLGLKSDRSGERQVTRDMGETLANSNGWLFAEASCATGDGVQAAGLQLPTTVLKRCLPRVPSAHSRPSDTPTDGFCVHRLRPELAGGGDVDPLIDAVTGTEKKSGAAAAPQRHRPPHRCPQWSR